MYVQIGRVGGWITELDRTIEYTCKILALAKKKITFEYYHMDLDE